MQSECLCLLACDMSLKISPTCRLLNPMRLTLHPCNTLRHQSVNGQLTFL